MTTPLYKREKSKHKRTGRSSASPFEADIALLSNLLSQKVDECEPDATELLRRVDTAESIANGVEERLDGIIDHIDSLLSGIEARAVRGAGDSLVATQVDQKEVGVSITAKARDSHSETAKK
ncbi:hypothetical protein C8Q79DRAFT_939097 [Trametes meyenii]|nr:hypothetical protein C8Q79DRAFT_939097 [Trametes meyenii]